MQHEHHSSEPPLIDLHDATKIYRLGRERANFRQILPGRLGDGLAGSDRHVALDGISLRLSAGESVGVVGHNGAGKSTLLKVLAGVTRVNSGHVSLRGRTAALIELGTGFHPDLTGRENVRFSAAVMGMGRRELRNRFDAIVDFADIGEYLDTPVKRYSSGMMARLGFAVASHLDAEVIVVDEVLAVGDLAFQRKCHERMRNLRDAGTALVYVTHSLWTVPALCQRAILLDHGKMISAGAPNDVIAAYRVLQDRLQSEDKGRVVLREVVPAPDALEQGDDLIVSIDLEVREVLEEGYLLISILSTELTVLLSVFAPAECLRSVGRRTITCELPDLPLLPNTYFVYATVMPGVGIPVPEAQLRVPLQVKGQVEAADHYGYLRLAPQWDMTDEAPDLDRSTP